MAISSISRMSLLCALLLGAAHGFLQPAPSKMASNHQGSFLFATFDDSADGSTMSRRAIFTQATAASLIFVATAANNPRAALAAGPAVKRASLESSLYTILRVREATQQETRLIKSGKFKDLQRANVKLAVKFMIENYKLNDAFVGASTYLDGNDRRVAAVNVGQNAIQDLYTILEYFDSSDVQNLKVGSASLSSDKEAVVVKGLEATRKSIDEFLGYFPKDMVDTAKEKVKGENELNFKEFDRNLGEIINQNPQSS